MKISRLSLILAVCSGFVISSCGGSDSGAQTKNAALPKSPSITAQGDCKDGEMVEGEDDDNCTLSAKVGNSTRKVVLETLNTDDEWDTVDSVVAKKGAAKFELAATDEDGIWIDGDYTFRVRALKSGRSSEVISKEFDISFMSSSATDDSTAGDGEDSGSSPEMQAAMDDIDNPATKFDDNCKKKFSKSDCSLMFRPNKGPDFAALGKDKWAKMCSTLLNRPAADCEKEFQFGMSGGPKPNGMFGQGGASQGPALDPAKVAAACAAIGMSETDCRDAIKAGPMVALQKFGSKSELFCTTYGAASCADLMAKMAPPGNPSSQPGAPGGSTQQSQQGAGGNGPSNDKIKAACATAGVSDDDCSKLMSANVPGSTMRPRDIVMSWGADKSEKFCQAIAQRSCSELMK